MCKILMITCVALMIPSVVIADDETVETCAGGAGTVVVNKVTGAKHCLSNKGMNWWNAVAWCDAQGRKLVDLNTDCGCNSLLNCSGECPGLAYLSDHFYWSSTPSPTGQAYNIAPSGGPYIGANGLGSKDYPLCQ